MKQLAFLLLILNIAGCADTQKRPLDSSASSTIRGKTLILVHGESPDFVAMTSGKGMFSVIGVGAAVAEGNRLVEEKKIDDPAIKISETIANVLTDRYDMQNQGRTTTASSSGNVEDIAKKANGYDYALEVTTNGWQYIYDGFNFSDYFVGYTAKIRLIDVSKSNIIANDYCIYDSKKFGKSPVTHDELLENDAAYIKKELVSAAQYCADQFQASILN